MKIGIVTGAVWATRKCAELTGSTLLIVQIGADQLVAVDLVGAGNGEAVLITRGAPASHICSAPADAAIVAILDKQEDSHEHQ